MNERINAIFEKGVFRPLGAVNIPEGKSVSLKVELEDTPASDLSDIADLLDIEFMEFCRQNAGNTPSLEDVQNVLSAFNGSLADRISAERDER